MGGRKEEEGLEDSRGCSPDLDLVEAFGLSTAAASDVLVLRPHVRQHPGHVQLAAVVHGHHHGCVRHLRPQLLQLLCTGVMASAGEHLPNPGTPNP